MEIKDKILIAEEFSKTPGARYVKDGGKFSGEIFLKDILRPRLDKAIEENYILEIILDGALGYPSSFISGSFGKLSLEKTASLMLKHIVFVSEDNPLRAEKIIYQIEKPKKK